MTEHHRGPHPEDGALFAAALWPMLGEASDDLAWLLGRGYGMAAALGLVGNRFQLADRQRTALMRSVCTASARAARAARHLSPAAARGATLWLDGFNVIMTVEAALAGGTLLRGRDGCIRNLAPMHTSYRKVVETEAALGHIGKVLSDLGVTDARWLLDRPVSNSGRLRALMLDVAAAAGWSWDVELAPHVDYTLKTVAPPGVVATTDSVILDACGPWLDVARLTIAAAVPDAPIIAAFGDGA
ncbi:MAG: DUF434 domain-containing protein [Myxococcota bacterium]